LIINSVDLYTFGTRNDLMQLKRLDCIDSCSIECFNCIEKFGQTIQDDESASNTIQVIRPSHTGHSVLILGSLQDIAFVPTFFIICQELSEHRLRPKGFWPWQWVLIWAISNSQQNHQCTALSYVIGLVTS